MAKGVLGNDPFQRGAAQRPSKPEAPSKDKGQKGGSRKKGPAKGKKPAPPSKAASASKPPGKKSTGHGVAARPPPAPPPTQASLPPAPSEVPPPSPEGAAPREPLAHAVAADTSMKALRELEATLGGPLPVGAVAVPGFEDEEARAPAVPEGEEPAPIEEPEPGLEPASTASGAPGRDASEDFFTAESPGAEPHGLGSRFTGLLSLTKEVAFQALASERLGRTMGSAQGLLGATLTGLGVGGGTALDEYGKDGTLTSVLQPVLDFLYERYWRVSVQGASHVPSGPVLLVANHSGALPLDGPVLQQSLTRERPDLQEARWLAEDQVFHAPMLGTLMNRLGAVRACPENALRLLDELRPLIVFPEGIHGMGKPFAQRYQLKRFGRGGFVKLALRTGAPIVPVAIVGAEETAPLLAKIPASFLGIPYLPLTSPPLPARWTIRFGEPIGVGEVPPEAAEDLFEVQRLTERTREAIQGMLQALLKERRSVFGG